MRVRSEGGKNPEGDLSRRDVRRGDVCRSSGSGFLEALYVCLSLGIGRAKGVEVVDFD
jgi:hypothetical protein